jgi:hypothetical protein
MRTPVISLLSHYIPARLYFLANLRQIDRERETFKWTSNVTITVRNLDGRIVDQFDTHNMIMNVGKNMARDLLRDTIADGKIKYVAIGTGATAVANTQIQLVTEVFRKVVTRFTIGGTGALTTTVYISPAEANVGIQEVGWFAGPAAAGTINTGIMTSRVLYAHAKTNLESLQIDRTDVFA